jgi:trans-aconitate methyltransferase
MICSCKNNSRIEKKLINFPSFIHDSYNTVSKKFLIQYCKKCEFIINNSSKKFQKHFRTAKYINNSQTKYGVYSKTKRKIINRNIFQTNLIKKVLKINNPQILDIGCNDFNLLKILSQYYKKGNFYGHDVDNKFKKFCPLKKNFNFYSKNIESIKEKFDLIIFSQSIYFIQNLKSILNKLKTNLNKNGLIFISIDDYKRTPISFFQMDRRYHFTEETLKKLLCSIGLKTVRIKSPNLHQELITISKINEKYKYKFSQKLDFLKKLLSLSARIRDNIRSLKNGKFYILGITSKAAFIDEFLPCTVGFVEENIPNNMKKFRGKNIVSPSNLGKRDTVLVLTNNKVDELVMRLNKKYKAKFVGFK